MTLPKVAVLLVAGVGSRLGAAANGGPKALVDVGGETMLARAMRLLEGAGVERFVLATGHGEERIREATKHLGARVTLCKNDDYARTQNAVSLFRCRDAVAGEDFVKLDGDVVFAGAALERLARSDAELAVLVDRRPGLGEEEMKVLAERGRITRFGKRIDPKKAAGETMGIEVVRARFAGALFDRVARATSEGRVDLYYEDHYDALLDEGFEAALVDVSDLPWTEVDTPEDLERARSLVASMDR